MSKAPPTLRVGINAWPGYEFIYLAQELGLYKKIGIDVKLIEFNSLSDARRAFERGQIDALGTTVIEVLQSRENTDRSLQIVSVSDYSDGADLIIANKKIPDIKSLKGKTVGLELSSLGVYVLARALEKNGLTLNDLNLQSLNQQSLAEALQAGELDAIVTYPPTSIKLLANPDFHTLFDTKAISGEVLDVIAIDEQFIQQHPAAVKQFIAAFEAAYQYSLIHPDQAYAIMAAREGITADEFKHALNDGIKIISLAEQAAYFKNNGKLDEVILRTDKILRQNQQIKGSDQTKKIISPLSRPETK
ncbi:ABC transporter substrate-binding protein [Deefgea piscis]|uniref:ABC transporter substrate-binding protein n=1 Tax=Deefgea piscis TaxID=2739061 RepID=UPI001C809E75|nr:ABC transporter substrate-binding protein [Deefgea piscis]QZA80463.1 ABC transporter substrate-binding protein [Deefgea piscis]